MAIKKASFDLPIILFTQWFDRCHVGVSKDSFLLASKDWQSIQSDCQWIGRDKPQKSNLPFIKKVTWWKLSCIKNSNFFQFWNNFYFKLQTVMGLQGQIKYSSLLDSNQYPTNQTIWWHFEMWYLFRHSFEVGGIKYPHINKTLIDKISNINL